MAKRILVTGATGNQGRIYPKGDPVGVADQALQEVLWRNYFSSTRINMQCAPSREAQVRQQREVSPMPVQRL